MITREYIRSSAVAAAPMTVGCTRCLAGRGSRCRSTGGYQNSAVGFHKARKDAIAHLDEQQRYDAYVEMRAEEAELRARVSAQLARPLTPQQVESRRRTREAWAQAGRDATAELRAGRAKPSPVSVLPGVLPVSDLAAERARRRGAPTSGSVA